MSLIKENKYTPETIDHFFSIPLYQRLFEWEETEIIQLLSDLFSSFKKDSSAPYYIGMLTVYKGASEERYSLVDGQQRFTVLCLMGIAFGWEEFLKNGDDYRLSFFARKNDEGYLSNRIDNKDSEYVNKKMDAGIQCIKDFIGSLTENNVEEFKNYIRIKTTFFISELPGSYSVQALNRYFEAMNEAGKGLENHEILKVQLLQKANNSKDIYTKIWNVVSEMDKCHIRQKENESQRDYRERNVTALENKRYLFTMFENSKESDDSEKTSILEIEASQTKPSENEYERGERAILSFSEFLLQVLWLCLSKEERDNSTDFFNKYKLLETFNKYILQDDGIVKVEEFFENLQRYRLMFDYFVIRLNNRDNRNTNYSLNMSDAKSETSSLKRDLIHFQSMLYVSTQSHIWLTPLLETINRNNKITFENLLLHLKIWDNERHYPTKISLRYREINRYWFWRLDYYLWEKRDSYFDDATRKIADNYIFRTNRSIEHISPQTPQSISKIKFEGELLHSFGNLAMISAGQNSSLQNASYEVKRAHVESFVNESIGGSIESLKMLKLYQKESWDNSSLKEHHNEMIDVLIESFGTIEDDPTKNEFIQNLKEQKDYTHGNQN